MSRSEMTSIAIINELDIVAARVEGRNLAKELGFGIIDQARIATAISELARNVVLYAQSGRITLKRVWANDKVGIEILCEDQGQGIDDLESVMLDDDSATRGVGVGLPGTRRLMDEFEIQSQLGVGTTVLVRKWLR
jgi:serine/threonine-protein kinase RsbT